MSDASQAYPSSEGAADELARLGITRVPADYYLYGEYRYTSLKDAMAQAERDREARKGKS